MAMTVGPPEAGDDELVSAINTTPLVDVMLVLLIMTDDAGFGVPSTFGGVIPTPALDRIAAREALQNRR